MESEKIGIDNLIYKAEIETQREQTYRYRGKRGVLDELGDWDCDWHIYTTETMYKIDN